MAPQLSLNETERAMTHKNCFTFQRQTNKTKKTQISFGILPCRVLTACGCSVVLFTQVLELKKVGSHVEFVSLPSPLLSRLQIVLKPVNRFNTSPANLLIDNSY